jgi:hypothetical protein
MEAGRRGAGRRPTQGADRRRGRRQAGAELEEDRRWGRTDGAQDRSEGRGAARWEEGGGRRREGRRGCRVGSRGGGGCRGGAAAVPGMVAAGRVGWGERGRKPNLALVPYWNSKP